MDIKDLLNDPNIHYLAEPLYIRNTVVGTVHMVVQEAEGQYWCGAVWVFTNDSKDPVDLAVTDCLGDKALLIDSGSNDQLDIWEAARLQIISQRFASMTNVRIGKPCG